MAILEFGFPFQRGMGQQVHITDALKDGDTVVGKFVVPADYTPSAASCAFANQGHGAAGNTANDLTMACEDTPGAIQRVVTGGALSGSIMLTGRRALVPGKTYYVKVATSGDAPDGIRVKLTYGRVDKPVGPAHHTP